MLLATYRLEGTETTAGRVENDELVTLPFPNVGVLLSHEDWRELAGANGPRQPLEENKLGPLIPNPPKIWCVGMNYTSHLSETDRPIPDYPALFAKFPSALTGPFDSIVLPEVSDRVDWEVELAVVVGRGGRSVKPSEAMDYVAGYAVINDVSMRDWQRRSGQYLQGKTFGACTPFGPHLVTPDEAPNPEEGLILTCSVNGDVVQSGKSDEMVFSVRQLVAYVSDIAPLEPGDVIATGTPAGIGALHKPPRFLRSGDVVESAVEGVGVLRNQFVDVGTT